MKKILLIAALAAVLMLTACDSPERGLSESESSAEMCSSGLGSSSGESSEVEDTYTVITTNTKADGRINVTTEMFNEYGNRIYLKKGDDEQRFTYKYDADGNIIEREELVGRFSFRTVYEYENGLLVKSVEYDMDGEIERIITYSYDDHGEQILEKNESPQISAVYYSTRLEIEYDAEGRKSTVQGFDYETGELSYTITYEYDERGNMIRSAFENQAYTGTTVYDCDSSGNVTNQVETVVYNDGKTNVHRWEYSYDTNGRPTLEIFYSQDISGVEYEFERYEYEYK